MTIPDFRTYYKAIMTQAFWYWLKNIHTSMEYNGEFEQK